MRISLTSLEPDKLILVIISEKLDNGESGNNENKKVQYQN